MCVCTSTVFASPVAPCRQGVLGERGLPRETFRRREEGAERHGAETCDAEGIQGKTEVDFIETGGAEASYTEVEGGGGLEAGYTDAEGASFEVEISTEVEGVGGIKTSYTDAKGIPVEVEGSLTDAEDVCAEVEGSYTVGAGAEALTDGC